MLQRTHHAISADNEKNSSFFCVVAVVIPISLVRVLRVRTHINAQIAVVTPLADGDNEFKINLRICEAILSSCYDQFQIIKDITALASPVQWLDKTQNFKINFPCSHAWKTSDDYLVSIESTKTDFKAKSAKFQITSLCLFK